MAQVRGTNVDLYDNVDKTFMAVMKAQLKELPKIYPNVFNIKTSDRKFERIVTYVPFGDTQTKLTASSVLPVPVYCATCGYGHNGRAISTRSFVT